MDSGVMEGEEGLERTTSRKELEVPIQLVPDGGVVGAGGL